MEARKKVLYRAPHRENSYDLEFHRRELGKHSYVAPETLSESFLKRILKVGTSTELVAFENDPTLFLDRVLKSVRSVNRDIVALNLNGRSNDYPSLYWATITYMVKGTVHTSGGASLESEQESIEKAFGEYLERSSFFVTNNDTSTVFKRVKKLHFTSTEIPRPRDDQSIALRAPHDKTYLHDIDCVHALNVTRKNTTYMPAQCFFYGSGVNKNVFLHQTTTNGGGGGVSVWDARVSAVCELIERDHFLLHWLSGISPKKIIFTSLPKPFQQRCQYHMERYNLEYYFLDTSYDTQIFSCIAVVLDRVKQKVAIGGSAGINPERVLQKSLTEALIVIQEDRPLSEALSEETIRTYTPFSDSNMDEKRRSSFYNSPVGLNTFEKLFLQGEPEEYGAVLHRLSLLHPTHTAKDTFALLSQIFDTLSESQGSAYHLYIHDFKRPLLAHYDYFVSKAYVPAFYKLWLNEDRATPLSQRLITFAQTRGKPEFSFDHITTLPHPFP